MTTTIDQKTFEKYVPAFASASDDTFVRMVPYIELVGANVQKNVGEHATDTTQQLIERYICVSAARIAAPQLDLVLTPNGFGVVSSQNVVPASRERVNALIEQLRNDESTTFDLIVANLLDTDWAKSPIAEQHIASLLYIPTMMRRYGIKDSEGKEVYFQEWQGLQNELAIAEEKVRTLISPELYDRLIEIQRIPDTEARTEYNIVLEQARKVVASWITVDRYPQAPRALSHRLLDTINRYADKLKEYSSSSTYRARNTQGYENKKEDSAYFFG